MPVFTHDAEHIGQIHFALDVVGRNPSQSRTQLVCGERVDTGVDFVDQTLFFGGVFVLNDPGDVAVFIAQDAAVAGRVFNRGGQNGCRVALGFVALHEFSEQLEGKQRDVAVGHQDGAFSEVVHRFKANLDCAAGAWDLVLVDDAHVRRMLEHVGCNAVTLVTHNHDEAIGFQRMRGIERVADHRTAAECVEDFRLRGFHTCSSTCG